MKNSVKVTKILVRIGAYLSALAAVLLMTFSQAAYADEEKKPVRKFNDVLFDLLNEFAYDLKLNQAQAIKNVSIRRVSLSEAIPKSYEAYLESLVTERLRTYSRIRVIQCTTCKVKRSTVENGKLVITSPINNPAELDNIAIQQSIDTWLDVALLYQESGMILAFNAMDSKTKELIWTRTYNSETIYRKQAGLDPGSENAGKDPDAPRTPSTYVIGVSGGWHLVPNVTTTSNMLGLNIRMAEQFNFKRSEIGAMVAPVVDPSILVSSYDNVEGDPVASGEISSEEEAKKSLKPFSFGVALFATYHHMFIKLPENFEIMRWGLHVGIGGIYAPGYITFTARSGGILKFGRKFFLEFAGAYSMPTTISVRNEFTYKTKGGVGADATFGILF